MAKIIFRAHAKFDLPTSSGIITGTAQCQMFSSVQSGIIKANFGSGLIGIPVGKTVSGNIVNGVLKDENGVDGIPLMAKNTDVQVSGALNYQAIIHLHQTNTRIISTFAAPVDTTPVDLLTFVNSAGALSTIPGLPTLPLSQIGGIPGFMSGLILTSQDAPGLLQTIGAPSLTAPGTMLQKRIVPRVVSITSSATPAINIDNVDVFSITALATAITSMTSGLTGDPTDGQRLQIRFRDNGTARSITWGSSFTGQLLATTVINKTHVQELVYDGAIGKWAGVLVDTAGY